MRQFKYEIDIYHGFLEMKLRLSIEHLLLPFHLWIQLLLSSFGYDEAVVGFRGRGGVSK